MFFVKYKFDGSNEWILLIKKKEIENNLSLI